MHASYNSAVKIGNWQEERALQEQTSNFGATTSNRVIGLPEAQDQLHSTSHRSFSFGRPGVGSTNTLPAAVGDRPAVLTALPRRKDYLARASAEIASSILKEDEERRDAEQKAVAQREFLGPTGGKRERAMTTPPMDDPMLAEMRNPLNGPVVSVHSHALGRGTFGKKTVFSRPISEYTDDEHPR